MRIQHFLYALYIGFLCMPFAFAHELAKQGTYEIYRSETFFLIGISVFLQYLLYYFIRFRRQNAKPINIFIGIIGLATVGAILYLLSLFRLNYKFGVLSLISMSLSTVYAYSYINKSQQNGVLKSFILALTLCCYTIVLPLSIENRLEQLNFGFSMFALAFLFQLCYAYEFKGKTQKTIGYSNLYVLLIGFLLMQFFLFTSNIHFTAPQWLIIYACIHVILLLLAFLFPKKSWLYWAVDGLMLLWPIALFKACIYL